MPTPKYIKDAQNAYNAKFDLVQLKLPKGTKERIKAVLRDEQSVSGYCKQSVLDTLENRGDSDREIIRLEFPVGTKSRIKNLGISDSDLADKCLNFIAGIEGILNEDSGVDKLPIQTACKPEIKPETPQARKSTKETGKTEIEANTASQMDEKKEEADSSEEEPCAENGFNELVACDWNKEKHNGIVPHPPMGTPDNAIWDSGAGEWYESLPF